MYITEDKTTNPYHKELTNDIILEEAQKLSVCGDGKKLMEYLIMVGKADNNSQNPELTKKPLHMLETMEKMLNSLPAESFDSQKQKG